MADDARRPVLIIVAGVMRSYRTTFAALQHSLIAPNEARYRFEVVVSTDIDVSCTAKDFAAGCCVEPLEASAYPWANTTGAALLAEIRATYGALLADVVSLPATRNGSSTQQWARIRAGVGQRRLDAYAAVYVTRPDVVLTRGFTWPVLKESRVRAALGSASPSSLLPTVDLASECAQRGGLSLVEGSFVHGHGDGGGLVRDSDFAFLACDPLALLAFFFKTRAPNQPSCRREACAVQANHAACAESWAGCAGCSRSRCEGGAQPQPPPVPREFRDGGFARTSCAGPGAYLCTSLAQFAKSGRRLGTLGASRVYAAIVRSHEPGGCGAPPPLERSCAYERWWARPEGCSPQTDGVARCTLAPPIDPLRACPSVPGALSLSALVRALSLRSPAHLAVSLCGPGTCSRASPARC